MWSHRRNWAAAYLLGCALAAHAQELGPGHGSQVGTAEATPTGSVTGTVIVQDTQRPARFVEVMLQSVASASGQSQVRGDAFFNGGGWGRTDVDGTFTIGNVAPGDYYVMAGAPGFIPERSLLQAAVAAGADPSDLLTRVPTVHVVGDASSSITVNLQRGGTLSGLMLWEDGSPAAGISVSATLNAPATALPATLQGIRSPGNNTNSAMTDDRGVFRIAGLPSGDYLLEAIIQSRAPFGGFDRRGPQTYSIIRDYSPGTFHKAAAKPITVRAGEERDDLRMVIDLRGLHTVSGHVNSANAGQNIQSGRVSLTDPTDTALQLQGSIAPDGSFAIRYVPPGSYTLQISGASTQAAAGYRGRGSSSSGTSFRPFSAAVTVTDADLSGFTATLTPVQSAQ